MACPRLRGHGSVFHAFSTCPRKRGHATGLFAKETNYETLHSPAEFCRRRRIRSAKCRDVRGKAPWGRCRRKWTTIRLLILEQHVVPAVRDGQIAVAVGTVELVGLGDHAIVSVRPVLMLVEFGADQSIPTVDLGDKCSFESDLIGVGRLEVPRLFGQVRSYRP